MTSFSGPSITYTKSIDQLDHYGKCDECGKYLSDFHWCPICQNKAFKREFGKWTSGNTNIDKIIQQTQLEVNKSNDYLEWIPFVDFDNVEYLTQGAFSTIYSGCWIDGPRRTWNEESDDWIRNGPTRCVLKRIENSQTLSQYYLDNVLKHNKCLRGGPLADYLGITRDPTGCYMFVMKFYKGNLYQYLDKEMAHLHWRDIVKILLSITDGLERIHENKLYHGNLHGGNLLFENNPELITRIADVGLHGPADRTASEIYGVLPYVAPEVLNGNEYTQASDVYSFGIIMWTLSACIRPFSKIPHDIELLTKICNGLRPGVVDSTPEVYIKLMKRCWDQDSNNRPTVTELNDILRNWITAINHNTNSTISIQFDNAEKKRKLNSDNIIFMNRAIHPKAIYTSQLLNFK